MTKLDYRHSKKEGRPTTRSYVIATVFWITIAALIGYPMVSMMMSLSGR